MFDADVIKELSKAQAIQAANAAIDRQSTGAIALPSDHNIHDLEKFMPTRRRLRGAMVTSVIGDFASYAKKNAELGAAIFIEPESMIATAVLNLGTQEKPGHADNTARLEQKRTAAYESLRKIADGKGYPQSAIAEFLEDWINLIACHKDGADVPANKAIAAVRKISIEALRKLESAEQQLSASRSAFESVTASSTEPLPTEICFTCVPYKDIAERTFVMRLGILTGADKPAINLRIIKIEEHEEQMAEQFAECIVNAIGNDDIPAMLGKYAVK